jgi:uncharacterized protein YgiM (DUF1202 family)
MSTENSHTSPDNQGAGQASTSQVRCAPGIFLTPEQTRLLRDAFPNEKAILVKEEFRSGYSGAVVILVTVGAGRAPLVVKFAHPHDLQQEYDAYVEFVRQVSPQNIAHLQGEPIVSPDGQLGILQYTFAGGESHLPTNSLQAYYETAGAEDTAAVLNRIFRVYGRHWWANNHAESYVLDEHYDRLLPVHFQAKPITVEGEPDYTIRSGESSSLAAREAKIGQTLRLQNLEVIKSRDGGRKLTLRAVPPNSEATAPLRIRVESSEPSNYCPGDAVDDMTVEITATRLSLLGEAAQATLPGLDPQAKQFTLSVGAGDDTDAGGIVLPNPLVKLNDQLYSVVETKMSVIHGDLNLQNVLVDMPTGFSWLIDFAETRVGPTLLDLQRLEVQVVTKLMPQGGGIPLAAVVEMMTRLHADPPLPAPPQPKLAEPYTLLVTIRRLARNYLIDDLDWNEYYYGLVVALIGALKYDELDDSARRIAFVCAAAADSLIGKPLQTTTTGATETQLIVVADTAGAARPIVSEPEAPKESVSVAAADRTPPAASPTAKPAAAVVAPKPQPAAAVKSAAPPSSSRSKGAGIALGAVALLLVALAVFWFATRSSGPDSTATTSESEAGVAAATTPGTDGSSGDGGETGASTGAAASGAAAAVAGSSETETPAATATNEATGVASEEATTEEAASDTGGANETPTGVSADATATAQATADRTTTAEGTSDATSTAEATSERTPTLEGTNAGTATAETTGTATTETITPSPSETGSAQATASAATGTPSPAASAGGASLESVFTLNVRSGPGTQFDTLGSLVAGTAADVIGKATMDDGDWYQIEYPPDSGASAWITGNPSLVTVSGDAQVPSIAQSKLPTPPPTTAAPVRPATLGGEIYYSATTLRGVDNIYRVSASGGTPQVIVEQGRQPNLTADGSQLAYQSTDGTALGIRSLSLSSNRSTQYSGAPEDSLPSWRPGGGTLIYASNREGDRAYRLYVTSGGGNEVQLDRGTEPDWHPTRDLIVYRGCDNTGARCGLWTMQSDGTNKQQLTDDSSDSRPRWSPDGRSVVFMSRNRDSNWEVYSVDVASGDVERLTNNPASDGLPVYSPDGGSIAFLTNRDGGTWEIYTMDTQGGSLQSVIKLDSTLPDWLSEGLDWTQ